MDALEAFRDMVVQAHEAMQKEAAAAAAPQGDAAAPQGDAAPNGDAKKNKKAKADAAKADAAKADAAKAGAETAK